MNIRPDLWPDVDVRGPQTVTKIPAETNNLYLRWYSLVVLPLPAVAAMLNVFATEVAVSMLSGWSSDVGAYPV